MYSGVNSSKFWSKYSIIIILIAGSSVFLLLGSGFSSERSPNGYSDTSVGCKNYKGPSYPHNNNGPASSYSTNDASSTANGIQKHEACILDPISAIKRRVLDIFQSPQSSCIQESLDLQEATYGKLTPEFTAVALSNVVLKLTGERDGEIHYSDCSQQQQNQSPITTELPKKILNPFKLDFNPQLETHKCTATFDHTPVVVLRRPAPINHIGHRMLTDWPSLFSIRNYLVNVLGISDMSDVTLVYVDTLGGPAWGAPNFQGFLESMGWKKYYIARDETRIETTLCFKHAIFLSSTFWQSHYLKHDENMWDVPDKLFDLDPFAVEMVEQLREYVGISPRQLGFVPNLEEKQKIVFASRDPVLRRKLGYRPARELLNESQLVAALRKQLTSSSSIEVVQVEFGEINLEETIKLLDSAAMFVSVHGAALDFASFLHRGGILVEILPSAAVNRTTVASKAATTGKQFIRYVVTDPNKEYCCFPAETLGAPEEDCEYASNDDCDGFYKHLEVDIPEMVEVIDTALKFQRLMYKKW